MVWEFNPIVIPLWIGGAVLLGIAGLAWRRRTVRGAWSLGLSSLAAAIYALGYAGELGSLSADAVHTWLKVEYVGVASMAIPTLMLAITYSEYQRFVSPMLMTVLMIIPSITILFALTNEFHHLIWNDIEPNHAFGYTRTFFEPGGWYWVNITYNFSIMMASIFLMARALSSAVPIYRQQLSAMLVALLIPAVVFVVYVIGITPEALDLNAFALPITSIILAWSIFNYRLMDLTPVPRTRVLNNIHDAVIVLDAQGRMTYLNPAAIDALRLELKDSIGQAAAAILPAPMQPFLNTTANTTADVTLNLAGKQSIFNVRRSSFYRDAGRLEGHILVLHDITERVEAEQALQKMVAELEAYAHTVAHDLKAPMGVIMGFSELVMMGFDSRPREDLMGYLTSMSQRARKANDIIDALLKLAEVRKMDSLELEPLDMKTIVQDVQASLQVEIEQRQAEILIQDQWLAGIGYAPWVEEIWANYLSNALKYGGSPPRIELGCESQANQVRFWIKDNGAGLASEVQTDLFLPFTRLDVRSTNSHGLGLSIVQRIAERLNGEVGVKSEVGKGSCFYFTLPKAASD